jgi:hypothetical protein
MFYNLQSQKLLDNYKESLSLIGSLSNLFSDSKTPYLYYRVAEKIFCESFNATDLSRGDISLDASKSNIGIGLKTFLKNNDKTLQKVAEFNKDREVYKDLDDTNLINKIAYLRNERINFAQNLSASKSSIYHCVIRSQTRFQIYEESMDFIDLSSIGHIKRKKNSISFDDAINEYNFNLSKSTLLKRFHTDKFLDEFEINIYDNPLKDLKECLYKKDISSTDTGIKDTIFLPLYSKDRVVSLKSGLNQWNASGRIRDADEIYIPIPVKVHKYSKSFFPPRDTSFFLHLPNGDTIDSKVCQDNSKALMSNPNKDLGKWLLRDVLNLKEGELLTYEKLKTIGIDSVKIDKLDEQNYKISFTHLGSYENYLSIYED